MKNEKICFPSHYIPNSEKEKVEYGLKYAKAIENEWFNPTNNTYSKNRIKYDELRKRARGEYQDPKLQSILLNTDQTSYANYDFTPLQILPKFRSILVNNGMDRLFNLEFNAIDKLSKDEKGNVKKEILKHINNKELKQQLAELTGIEIPDPVKDMPQSDEETDMWMDLKYKAKVEVAAESLIDYIFNMNHAEEFKRLILGDLVDIGVGGLSVRLDKENGIVIDREDPAEMVYSFPEHSDFRNVYYYGKMKKIPVWKLREMGLQDVDKLARSLTSNTNNTMNESTNAFPLYREGDWDGVLVDVLHFTFKTIETKTYKKKIAKNGKTRINTMQDKVASQVVTNKDGSFEIINRDVDVWYEGTYILNSEIVLQYKKCENMVTSDDSLDIALPPYVMYAPEMYKGIPKGMIERVIPYERQMQLTFIKLQQMVAKAKPSGVYIDIGGLNEISMGDGNTLNPIELLGIYNDTGNVIGTSITRDGEFNHGKVPIQQLPNGVTGIEPLIANYNFNLNIIRDSLGIPQGMDASMPHPDTLVGVQQGVNMSSSIATRNILDSALNVLKRTAELCTYHLREVWRDARLKKIYEDAIGKDSIDVLMDMKEFSLRRLAIFADFKPSYEDIQRLNSYVQLALQNGGITIDEANDIINEGKTNIKKANLLFKYLRRKREREMMAREKEMMMAKSQADIQSAQAASQARMQEYEMKVQMEAMLMREKKELEVTKIKETKNAKMELMEKEFEHNVELQEMNMDSKVAEKMILEDRKDKRVAKQGNVQSKLIKQRADKGEPIEFDEEDEQEFDIPQEELPMFPEAEIEQGNNTEFKPFESSNDSMGTGIDLRSYG